MDGTWQDGRQQGSAMLIALAFVAVILCVSGTILSVTLIRSRSEVDRLRLEQSRSAAEMGLALAVARINTSDSPPSQVSGVLQSGPAKGARWAVTIYRHGDLYKVSAAAASGDQYRSLQAVIEKPPALPPIPAGLGGGVVSYFGIEMHANLVITGNNHDFNGNTIGGDSGATYGIVTGDTSAHILNNGNLSGNNQPPTGDNAVAIANGILKVGAAASEVPNTPGRALGMTDADLVAAAQAGGTYFTTESALTTWASGFGGGHIPNTSPIYLAVQGKGRGTSPLNSLSFDPSKAYIVVNHVPSGGHEPNAGSPPNGIASTGNVHINMKGILILDDAMHINGGSVINGAVVSLWGAGVQPKFGQGGA